MSRTLLHVVTDWPGHYPNGPQTVAALVAAGADVNGRFAGPHTETPLHWAASSDDVPVLDALLDAGADIEANGVVIGDGTAISDACAFAQWNAARRLIERGATTRLWESAALGLMDRIAEHFAADPPPTVDQVTEGLWAACHGDQREAAEVFLRRGGDINWVGYDDLTPLDAAHRSGAHDLAAWLRTQGAASAGESG
jgi:ankyrin repeat protein